MTVYTTLDSPLGELLLVGERTATGVALASLSVHDQRGGRVVQDGWIEDAAAFAGIIAQLRGYFDGTPTEFDIEFVSGGSEFQRRVWAEVDAIPYGTTVSYGEVATRIGSQGEQVRAVAAAIGANPLLIVRPCHRVIGANGALTGYAGGLQHKQTLLALENVLLAG